VLIGDDGKKGSAGGIPGGGVGLHRPFPVAERKDTTRVVAESKKQTGTTIMTVWGECRR
jgi:hypothetical protein